MKYDVVTIGDASEDIFIRPEGLRIQKSRKFVGGQAVEIELGEKIPVAESFYSAGGSALNTAVGLSKLGLKSSPIIILGDDRAGNQILESLKNEDYDYKNVIQKKDFKTHFSVVLNVQDERSIFVYRSLDNYDVLAPKKSLQAHWIYLGPIGDHTEQLEKEIIAKAAEKNTKLAWNPGSIQIKKGAVGYRSLLRSVSILILNREEAIKFANFPARQDIYRVMEILSSYGPRYVIVTNGKDGAYAYDGVLKYQIDAVNREKIDPTGAGDAFSTGFLGRIISADINGDELNKDIMGESLKWGIINSSSVVNQIGAQKGLLDLNGIKDESAKYPRLNASVL